MEPKKIVAPFLRTPYNYDTNKASDESGLACKDPTKTKQSFTEEADINTIVKRFALTGELPKDIRTPTYGDFIGVSNYHEALTAIAIAEESFYAMPAAIRTRFDNDPGKFVDFCSDDKNRQEAEKMGLVPGTMARAARTATAPLTPPKGEEKPESKPTGKKTDT